MQESRRQVVFKCNESAWYMDVLVMCCYWQRSL